MWSIVFSMSHQHKKCARVFSSKNFGILGSVSICLTERFLKKLKKRDIAIPHEASRAPKSELCVKALIKTNR